MARLQKGYRFFLAADQMVGDMTGFKFTTTHGAQFNNKIFLGGGIGFCIADDDIESYLAIPVYADFRFDILNKRSTPFVEARAGVAFAIVDLFSDGAYIVDRHRWRSATCSKAP